MGIRIAFKPFHSRQRAGLIGPGKFQIVPSQDPCHIGRRGHIFPSRIAAWREECRRQGIQPAGFPMARVLDGFHLPTDRSFLVDALGPTEQLQAPQGLVKDVRDGISRFRNIEIQV